MESNRAKARSRRTGVGRRTNQVLLSMALSIAVRLPLQAASNVVPDHSTAWGGNVGWLNWRPDAQVGVEAGQFVFAGSVYSANLGWISLGNGSPANGIQYSNASPADF